MKLPENSSCTCKNCGCHHHCDKECDTCRNDVCNKCNCEHCNPTINKNQDWAWQDSGIEAGF